MSKIGLKELPEENYLLPGHHACAGCGGALIARLAMKVFGQNTVVVIPASCLTSVTGGPFPMTGFSTPTVYCPFACTAAMASGIETALRIKGKEDINVLCIAGDGGTADIGIQALSGAVERGHTIKYICYDNEAYSNTGVQKSGTTPHGAWTTTTPVGKLRQYERGIRKDIALMMIAQGIDYSATASIAYPLDFIKKLTRMKEVKGPTYLHVQSPCPIGWRFDSNLTIEIARRAVLSGAWILYEYDDGKFELNEPSKRLSDPSKRIPLNNYLMLQGRFGHITDEEIAELQKSIEASWERIKMLAKI